MDPVTAAATAASAFKAVQKGFQLARSIEDMASDLSRWMGALSDLEQAEKEAKNPPLFKKLFAGSSVESAALEALAAKTKAEEDRAQLKQYIQYSYGQSKWDELVRMEGQIRRTRKETIYKQRELRRKFVEIVAIIVTVLTGIGILVLFVLWLKGLSQ
tara:strand:+ start:882 stop:1355 length:474 start_codon:yes stop_codon:yes gene_type:complete